MTDDVAWTADMDRVLAVLGPIKYATRTPAEIAAATHLPLHRVMGAVWSLRRLYGVVPLRPVGGGRDLAWRVASLDERRADEGWGGTVTQPDGTVKNVSSRGACREGYDTAEDHRQCSLHDRHRYSHVFRSYPLDDDEDESADD